MMDAVLADARSLRAYASKADQHRLSTGRYIEHADPADLAGLHLSLLQRLGVGIGEFGTASAPWEGLAI